LSDLDAGLKDYSNRIDRVMKSKWWYPVVRFLGFFGYRPGVVKDIESTKNLVQHKRQELDNCQERYVLDAMQPGGKTFPARGTWLEEEELRRLEDYVGHFIKRDIFEKYPNWNPLESSIKIKAIPSEGVHFPNERFCLIFEDEMDENQVLTLEDMRKIQQANRPKMGIVIEASGSNRHENIRQEFLSYIEERLKTSLADKVLVSEPVSRGATVYHPVLEFQPFWNDDTNLMGVSVKYKQLTENSTFDAAMKHLKDVYPEGLIRYVPVSL